MGTAVKCLMLVALLKIAASVPNPDHDHIEFHIDQTNSQVQSGGCCCNGGCPEKHSKYQCKHGVDGTCREDCESGEKDSLDGCEKDGGVDCDYKCCVKSIICPYPFEKIHGCCYYFSNSTQNWQGAQDACEGLHADAGLAELGRDEGCCNDFEFMVDVALKGDEFWFGAKSIDQGVTFNWQRSPQRLLPLNSNMWWNYDPLLGSTWYCLINWQGSGVSRAPRAYLGINQCVTTYKRYICQIFK